MPMPLFRTKSGDGQRRPLSRSSSRDLDKPNMSLLAMAATDYKGLSEPEQDGFSFRTSYESALFQSSQDMEDIMRRFQAVIGIDGDGSHKTAPRASAAALAKLPRARILRPYKKLFAHDESACGVCCEPLIDGVALVRLPCGHIYHINCSTSWLSKTCTCPECRYELETDDVLYEKTRATRMKDRETVSCNCHPSGTHDCFFNDPSRSLFKQLVTCVEVSDNETSGNLADSGGCSIESASDFSSCELADPNSSLYFF
jgi:hypothetical protein